MDNVHAYMKKGDIKYFISSLNKAKICAFHMLTTFSVTSNPGPSCSKGG